MTKWYDSAVVQIEQDYEDGLITGKEFQQAMRDLNSEYDDYAKEQAQQVYDDFY